MKETRVASRYAKSLVDLAAEKGVLDQVNNDMALFADVCKQNRDFMLAMTSPIITHDKKIAILTSLFKGRMNDITMSILTLISKKHREPLLLEISKEFQNQYRAKMGVKVAEVTTTLPLTDAQRDRFRSLLAKGATKVELVEKVDTAILGGFILKVGDQQIDESIRTKLNTLKNKFIDYSYIPKY